MQVKQQTILLDKSFYCVQSVIFLRYVNFNRLIFLIIDVPMVIGKL